MTDLLTVFIVCGVHNKLQKTKKLLECISSLEYRNLSVIIVDDGSTDGTADYIHNKYPDVTLLKGSGQLWWTGAINLGIAECLKKANLGDYVLIVNSDCIFDNTLITTLLKTSTEYNRAIVGSLIIDDKNRVTIRDAGVRIDWARGKFISLPPKNLRYLAKNKEVEMHIDTLSTKGTIYPVEVFHKIGNFDEIHLPHYISDYEFACRAKKSGYKLLLAYKAKIYNDVSNTGFGEVIPKKIPYRYLFDLLFSRRSRINIIDHFWFITLCCPMRYKLQNYLILFAKSLYLFSFVFPFNHLK